MPFCLLRPNSSLLLTSSILWCNGCESIEKYYYKSVGVPVQLLPTVLGLKLAVDLDLGSRYVYLKLDNFPTFCLPRLPRATWNKHLKTFALIACTCSYCGCNCARTIMHWACVRALRDKMNNNSASGHCCYNFVCIKRSWTFVFILLNHFLYRFPTFCEKNVS